MWNRCILSQEWKSYGVMDGETSDRKRWFDMSMLRCGGVTVMNDSVPEFYGSPLGPMGFRVFWSKIRDRLTDWAELWPTYRGYQGASTQCFLTGDFSCNSRNRRYSSKLWNFFSGEMGQGTVTKISPHTTLGGPRITQSKFRPWPLTILGNWGKTFLGVGGPMAPGVKILGVVPKLKTSSARGRPRVQNKIICGPLSQSTTAQ